MPLPYGRLLHPRPALTNCKSCRIHNWELPQDAHRTQTYTICINETFILPIHEHLQLHASQNKQKTQHPSHPLHKLPTYFNTPRLKATIFNNGSYTTNIPTYPQTITTTYIKTNMRQVHTSIVSSDLATRGNNKILCTPPPHIMSSEEILPRLTRRTLACSTQNIINHPSSNHIYTKSMQNHIHHRYAPFVTLTHTTHTISSTAHTH